MRKSVTPDQAAHAREICGFSLDEHKLCRVWSVCSTKRLKPLLATVAQTEVVRAFAKL